MILNEDNLKRHLDRAYVHQVIPVQKTYASDSSTKSVNHSHICYFITYIDAAIDAYHHNLIRAIGIYLVIFIIIIVTIIVFIITRIEENND